ncbi:protein NRT1/ PTR FAMILY 4.4-like isoform X3 [Panicum virgatum]|uniref:protein NRT1/ PTR FAMILY 4.4-like isoform X3 n=1 Tax=Panicum virgatum TaxID=38727 RepID=UPI0019D62AE1|nr:protein NRT1/ PTR FAMILY 4.4-like isoform X3 [Panicum virgatum]
MAIGGFVDWRGNPIKREVHGGVRAAWYMYFLTVVTNMVNVPILLNLVTYLRGTMHMGVSSSATTITNFVGATSGFSLIGAFLSDSYISRSKTILLFGPLEFLGYGLLALQAHVPSLHPPPCNIEAELSNCKEVRGWDATLFYTALYVSAFGEGCMRACVPSLGADQFDHEDPSESRQQSSFFNWFTFGISFGGFLGLIFMVWLENYKGWDIGLGLSSILILLGLLVVAAGLPFYRNQVLEGSPLTRILQVLVVAFRNRRFELHEELEEAQESCDERGSTKVLPQTNSLKFLDKACINHGKEGAWSLCSMTKVEETKIVLPRWHDKHKAGQDPCFPRNTLHHSHHIPNALVERKRKEAEVQMSLFWLAPQFFLLGVSDVTSFTGLLEFFNSEAPRGMKSIATALFWCEIGLASLLATFLVQAVNRATRHGHKGGWLEGTSLNNSHLDLFYWVVAVVGLLGFVNYMYWAKKYVYHQDPRIIVEPSVDQDSP